MENCIDNFQKLLFKFKSDGLNFNFEFKIESFKILHLIFQH